MRDKQRTKLRLEIAHVLFIDIVGYSKRSIDEQQRAIAQLNEAVQLSETYSAANAAGRLAKIPTGDGMALIFYDSPESPAECAMDVSRTLSAPDAPRVRMGIHSGPVSGVVDVNGHANVAGEGINIAQRVMDCGDANHILLSKRVADDLSQFKHWRPHLHDLGECEVKHNVRVGLVNLFTSEIGNSDRPVKVECAPAVASLPAATTSPRAKAYPWLIGAVVIVLAISAALVFWRSHLKANSRGAAAPIDDKSIAVLPFENLSRDADNAYFAAGIQEEILTRLARIAQLKVISRTSTAKYKSRPEDLKTVARELGVATVLEGSVQKVGEQARINVQLINANTDAHLWADTYDRELKDIFAVETEIAAKIADTLQAKLTGSENAAVAARPTENVVAHELYLRARYLVAKRTYEDSLKAIEYYNQAIARDSKYALAYAGLGEAYALITAYTRLPADEVLPKARNAAEKAAAIDPALPEAHNALSLIALSQIDLIEARREAEEAIKLNPNSPDAHASLAVLLLATGKSDAAIEQAKRAVELDPLSLPIHLRLGTCYQLGGRLPEAMDVLRKTIELDPSFGQASDRLGLTLQASGDLDAAIAQFQFSFEAVRRDDFHPLIFLAQAYARKGDRDKAIQTLAQAKELEHKRGAEWAYGYALVSLALGDKEEAMNWLERSYKTKESFALLLYIKVDPLLAPLRGHPRFEALANKIIPPSA